MAIDLVKGSAGVVLTDLGSLDRSISFSALRNWIVWSSSDSVSLARSSRSGLKIFPVTVDSSLGCALGPPEGGVTDFLHCAIRGSRGRVKLKWRSQVLAAKLLSRRQEVRQESLVNSF